ncbi:Uncharacterised protein [Brucella neotomae]|nr:Uncharacterised protein [Brucella neotomae]
MAGSAACNNTNLASDRCIFRGNDARIFRKANDIGVRFDKAPDGILNDFVRVVDETLHGISCNMNELRAQRMV